jgi:chitin disaccharide deacetylase
VEIYSHRAIANGELGTGEAELAALLSIQVREALLSNGFEITNHHFLSQHTI